jgi:hypothetical protein
VRTDNLAGTEHVFFLSYAHTPKVDNHDPADPDLLVAEFFRDLCRSLVQISDLPMGEGIGFMDREFRPGYKWPDRLARALATCKVFVPLYSPRYFSKENCGMEWFAFASRAAEVAARRGEQVEAIVPALWVPVPDERLPEVAQPIHYWTPDYGSRYASHGIYGLMTISKYKDQYKEVIHELASRILDVAEKFQLDPGTVPDYRSLRNAFKPADKEA